MNNDFFKPKFTNWGEGDCCMWDGIQCNDNTEIVSYVYFFFCLFVVHLSKTKKKMCADKVFQKHCVAESGHQTQSNCR